MKNTQANMSRLKRVPYDVDHSDEIAPYVDQARVAEQHARQAEAEVRKLKDTRPRRKRRTNSPLNLAKLMSAWVKSRHLHCTTPCPLYPRKQTFAVH
jgi:hypothetical protein